MNAPRFGISTLLSGTVFAVSLFVVAQGCGPADSPATGTGGSPGTGGASTGSGGASTTGSGGASTTGSGGASTTGSGGASTTGSGGASTTGSGGASTTGSGGASTGSGGSGTAAALCTTQAKGGACLTPTDVCGKTCGPDKKGTKLETCTGGLYVEGTCDFPAADYACYKLSAAVPACPAGTTTASGMNTCTMAACSACSGYTDSSGAIKVGYCVCTAGKWSCGSTKEWPCATPGVPTTAGGTGC